MKNTIVTLFASLALSKAYAFQPTILQIEKPEIVRTGSASAVQGTIRVKNKTQKTIKLKLRDFATQSAKLKWSTNREVLFPGESATLEFSGQMKAQGKHQLLQKIDLETDTGQRLPSISHDLYFKVTGDKYEVSDYESMFMDYTDDDKDLGRSFKAEPRDPKYPRGEDYSLKRASVRQMRTLTKENTRRIPVEDGLSNDPMPDAVRSAPTGSTSRSRSGNVTATGDFCFIGSDERAHPAFGWRVKAYKKGFLGTWSVVDEDWVESDGTWTLSLPKTDETYKFQYVAANEFFAPESSSGNQYKWVSDERKINSTRHDEGSRCADTSHGSARGLGEMYDEGMRMWSKLYHQGEIDPIRKSPIKVIFPNTKYDCGNGDGIPWSCANHGGKIWLTPSHARTSGVIQHELAHQINYEYWDNKMPDDAGGSHTLTDCAAPGLALTEGFANFMVAWVQALPTSTPSIDFPIENPVGSCGSPNNRNESWVAATFWDLHDARADDEDTLHFVHLGAVPSIYLNAGKRDTMAGFHAVYRNFPGVKNKDVITEIFKQNNIIDR